MEKRPKGFGYRHLQIILFFTGLTANLVIRTDLSVGIVAMTDKSTNSNFITFDWDEASKGIALSSFFWGYVVAQIPGGFVAHILGARYLFLMTVLASSILTALVPTIAPLGWQYVCALRVLTGFTQGFAFPCVQALMAKWVHPSERGLSAIVLSASPFGIFLIMSISGAIAKSQFGWPGIFYTSSSIGLTWSVFWLIFGSESPSIHNSISPEERSYLTEDSNTNFVKTLPLPWYRIFTSLPFLSLFFANTGQLWGFFTLMTKTPAYMSENLDFDITSSAMWSALPYLCMCLATTPMSVFSNFLINRRYLSTEATRKIFNTVGQWIPMACMIGMGFVTKETAHVAIILLIISATFNAGANVGFSVNHLDIAPNFAGTLFGMTNGFASIFSILAPIVVAYIVTDPTSSSQWSIVFFVSAGFYFIGNLVFIVFAKGTIQDWNQGKISKEQNSNLITRL